MSITQGTDQDINNRMDIVMIWEMKEVCIPTPPHDHHSLPKSEREGERERERERDHSTKKP